MKSCGMSVIKYIVYAYNTFLGLVGLLLLIAGIYDISNLSNVTQFANGALLVQPIALIVIGVILFAIAFLGCFGAVKESTKLLNTFAICLILILVLSVVSEIIKRVFKGDLGTEMKDTLKKTMGMYGSNDVDTEAWDAIQVRYMCCGTNGPSDWATNTGNQRTPPLSCCHAKSGDDQAVSESQCKITAPSNADYIYQDGCYSKIYFEADSSGLSFGPFILGLITMIVPIGLVFWLSMAIKKEDEISKPD